MNPPFSAANIRGHESSSSSHLASHDTSSNAFTASPLEWITCLHCLRFHPSVTESQDPFDQFYLTTCCHLTCGHCCGFSSMPSMTEASTTSPSNVARPNPPTEDALSQITFECPICSSPTRAIILNPDRIPSEIAPCFKPLSNSFIDVSLATNWQIDHLKRLVGALRDKCEKQKGQMGRLAVELKRLKMERRQVERPEEENAELRSRLGSHEGSTRPFEAAYRVSTSLALHRPGPSNSDPGTVNRRSTPSSARDHLASLPSGPARLSLPTTSRSRAEHRRPPSTLSRPYSALDLNSYRSPLTSLPSASFAEPVQRASTAGPSPRERLSSFAYNPHATPNRAPSALSLSARPSSRLPTRGSTRQRFEPLRSEEYRSRQVDALGTIGEESIPSIDHREGAEGIPTSRSFRVPIRSMPEQADLVHASGISPRPFGYRQDIEDSRTRTPRQSFRPSSSAGLRGFQ